MDGRRAGGRLVAEASIKPARLARWPRGRNAEPARPLSLARGDGPQTSVGAPAVVDPAQAPTDNHGAAVSAVAKDHTAVGGKNNNDGGAVSAVAHGGHGPNGNATGTPSTRLRTRREVTTKAGGTHPPAFLLVPGVARSRAQWISSTPSAAPGKPGVAVVGPVKNAFRQTPSMSLPPVHAVSWKPAKPMMWYQAFWPVAARGVPDGHGHGDLVVDVVRAVGARPCCRAGSRSCRRCPGMLDRGAAAVAVGWRPDLALEERDRVAAAPGIRRRILAEAVAVAAELEPPEAARDVEVARRQVLRVARARSGRS